MAVDDSREKCMLELVGLPWTGLDFGVEVGFSIADCGLRIADLVIGEANGRMLMSPEKGVCRRPWASVTVRRRSYASADMAAFLSQVLRPLSTLSGDHFFAIPVMRVFVDVRTRSKDWFAQGST
jgi:hypothetical protein